jgi:FkbM family methyltransferase
VRARLKRLLGIVVLPVTRRINFPGKRRLRNFVKVPESGTREVPLLGCRFKVDMTESMQRDYWFGVYDEVELSVVRRLLRSGGDFVDVGGHVGTYAVVAARALDANGRVLTFEPNPTMRAFLEENVRLNGCSNVIVSDLAVSEAPGRATLYVPRAGDVGWSSLSSEWARESDAVEVEVTTLDDAVARYGLDPGVVKIDVESYEAQVLRGAGSVLERRPALVVEIVEENLAEVIPMLARLGYAVARAGTRRLEPWPAEPRASNAVCLQPRHIALLRPREQRVFAHA